MWKIIRQFPNYEVSNDGKVRNTKTKKLLKPYVNKGGYFAVGLSKDGKIFQRLINRLVAEAFIPNLENKPQVNHKNGDKINNHVDNLEWVTAYENKKHAIENGLCSNSMRKVAQYTLDGKFVAEYRSLSEAAFSVGGHQSGITNVCQGKRKTCSGYLWKYVV